MPMLFEKMSEEEFLEHRIMYEESMAKCLSQNIEGGIFYCGNRLKVMDKGIEEYSKLVHEEMKRELPWFYDFGVERLN